MPYFTLTRSSFSPNGPTHSSRNITFDTEYSTVYGAAEASAARYAPQLSPPLYHNTVYTSIIIEKAAPEIRP